MKKLFLLLTLICPAISIAMDNYFDNGDDLMQSLLGNDLQQNTIPSWQNDLSFDNENSTATPQAASLLLPSSPRLTSAWLPEIKLEAGVSDLLPVTSSFICEEYEEPETINWADVRNRRYQYTLPGQIQAITGANLAAMEMMIRRSYRNNDIEELLKKLKKRFFNDLQPKCAECTKKDFPKTYLLGEAKQLLVDHYTTEHSAKTASFLATFDASPDKYIDKLAIIDLTQTQRNENSTAIQNSNALINTTQNLAATPEQLRQIITGAKTVFQQNQTKNLANNENINQQNNMQSEVVTHQNNNFNGTLVEVDEQKAKEIEGRRYIITCCNEEYKTTQIANFTRQTMKHADHLPFKTYFKNLKRDLVPYCPQCLNIACSTMYYTKSDIKAAIQTHYNNCHKNIDKKQRNAEFDQNFKKFTRIFIDNSNNNTTTTISTNDDTSNQSQILSNKNQQKSVQSEVEIQQNDNFDGTLIEVDEQKAKEITERRYRVECCNIKYNFGRYADLNRKLERHVAHNPFRTYLQSLKKDLVPYCPECSNIAINALHYTKFDIKSAIQSHYNVRHKDIDKQERDAEFDEDFTKFTRIFINNDNNNTTTTTSTSDDTSNPPQILSNENINQQNAPQQPLFEVDDEKAQEISKRKYTIICCSTRCESYTFSSFKRNKHFSHPSIQTYVQNIKNDLAIYCPLCEKKIGDKLYYTKADIKQNMHSHYCQYHSEINKDKRDNDFENNFKEYIRTIDNNTHTTTTTTRSNPSDINIRNQQKAPQQPLFEVDEQTANEIKKRSYTIVCCNESINSNRMDYLKKIAAQHADHFDFETYFLSVNDLIPYCPLCQKKLSNKLFYTKDDIKQRLQSHYNDRHGTINKDKRDNDFENNFKEYIRTTDNNIHTTTTTTRSNQSDINNSAIEKRNRSTKKTRNHQKAPQQPLFEIDDEKAKEIEERKYTITCCDKLCEHNAFYDFRKNKHFDHPAIQSYVQNIKNDLIPYCPRCESKIADKLFYTKADIKHRMQAHYNASHSTIGKDQRDNDFEENFRQYIRTTDNNTHITTTTTRSKQVDINNNDSSLPNAATSNNAVNTVIETNFTNQSTTAIPKSKKRKVSEIDSDKEYSGNDESENDNAENSDECEVFQHFNLQQFSTEEEKVKWQKIISRKHKTICCNKIVANTVQFDNWQRAVKTHGNNSHATDADYAQKQIKKYKKELIRDLKSICPLCKKRFKTQYYTLSDLKQNLNTHYHSFHANKQTFFMNDFYANIKEYVSIADTQQINTNTSINNITDWESIKRRRYVFKDVYGVRYHDFSNSILSKKFTAKEEEELTQYLNTIVKDLKWKCPECDDTSSASYYTASEAHNNYSSHFKSHKKGKISLKDFIDNIQDYIEISTSTNTEDKEAEYSHHSDEFKETDKSIMDNQEQNPVLQQEELLNENNTVETGNTSSTATRNSRKRKAIEISPTELNYNNDNYNSDNEDNDYEKTIRTRSKKARKSSNDNSNAHTFNVWPQQENRATQNIPLSQQQPIVLTSPNISNIPTRSSNALNHRIKVLKEIQERRYSYSCSFLHTLKEASIYAIEKTLFEKHIHNPDHREQEIKKLDYYKKSIPNDLQPKCAICREKNFPKVWTLADVKFLLNNHYKNTHSEQVRSFNNNFDATFEEYFDVFNTRQQTNGNSSTTTFNAQNNSTGQTIRTNGTYNTQPLSTAQHLSYRNILDTSDQETSSSSSDSDSSSSSSSSPGLGIDFYPSDDLNENNQTNNGLVQYSNIQASSPKIAQIVSDTPEVMPLQNNNHSLQNNANEHLQTPVNESDNVLEINTQIISNTSAPLIEAQKQITDSELSNVQQKDATDKVDEKVSINEKQNETSVSEQTASQSKNELPLQSEIAQTENINSVSSSPDMGIDGGHSESPTSTKQQENQHVVTPQQAQQVTNAQTKHITTDQIDNNTKSSSDITVDSQTNNVLAQKEVTTSSEASNKLDNQTAMPQSTQPATTTQPIPAVNSPDNTASASIITPVLPIATTDATATHQMNPPLAPNITVSNDPSSTKKYSLTCSQGHVVEDDDLNAFNNKYSGHLHTLADMHKYIEYKNQLNGNNTRKRKMNSQQSSQGTSKRHKVTKPANEVIDLTDDLP